MTKARTKKLIKTDTAPRHLVVRAYAGTGKTFSQIMGVAWAYASDRWEEIVAAMAKQKGLDPETFVIEPSEEQQAIWDHFATIKDVTSIIYCAFNKSIVEEFNREWGWLVTILQEEGVTLEFRTVNSLGNRAVYASYGRCSVTANRVEGLIAERLSQDIWELRRHHGNMLTAIQKLVDLCKLNLTGWVPLADGSCEIRPSRDEMEKLVAHYDIELNGEAERVYDIVPDILEECLKVEDHKDIDYNDQNWLPVVCNLVIPKVDLVLVDEGQDLPRCKQEFVFRLGRNIVVTGDVFQAIYGFAGADIDSIPRMEKMLNVSQPLTLTETRRCAKSIVAEAQKIVSDFQAHEDNGTGIVRKSDFRDANKNPVWREEVCDGDMCLCRVNGPIVSEALGFIKNGRKAIIRGRQFGQTLINFVEKMKATDISDLLNRVQNWYELESQKESRKKFPSESKLVNLEDRRDCVLSFSSDAATVEEVIEKIDLVFAGKQCPGCKKHFSEDTDRCPCKSCKTELDPASARWKVGPKLVQPEGIMLSSIHRAKGLEANRVFILQPEGAQIPHPMAKTKWQRKQEYNLLYVAITRAKEELVYVS